MAARRGPAFFALLSLTCAGSLLPACGMRGDPTGGVASSAPLTGISGEQRGFHFKSYVYVPTSASDADITTAIQTQVKTAIGALEQPQVIFDDLDAENNLDPTKWTRTTLRVVDPTGATPPSTVLRVDFPYDDVAVVSDTLSKSSSIDFTVLFGDFTPNLTTLNTDCSNDPTTDPGSFFYGYEPQLSTCQTLIENELTAIQTEEQTLAGATLTIGPHEAGRWFLPLSAQLDPPQLPAHPYSPEYERLYGLGTSKSQLVIYDFHGVDTDETDPDDLFGQEAIKFLRALLTAQPNFRPTFTNPFAMLESITVNGTALQNVTYSQMFSWLLDQNDYPPEVGTDAAQILALRQQAMAMFTERWIYWDLPVVVTDPNGNAKSITIEVRFFHGNEVGTPQIQQAAQWRYLEAFWYGDVFLYTGHSHFGNGPLEPTLYGPQNFNSNYQIMLINSCISYNYYHQDFIGMKPGGTENLDMVVNGLPAYVDDLGLATAGFVTTLIDGKQATYPDLLKAMEVNLPWASNYEPMRVVDGELDNTFSQAVTPLTVKVQPPVYP